MTIGRKRLPGDSDARYSGVPEAEQLFKIVEFSVAPGPPVVYEQALHVQHGV